VSAHFGRLPNNYALEKYVAQNTSTPKQDVRLSPWQTLVDPSRTHFSRPGLACHAQSKSFSTVMSQKLRDAKFFSLAAIPMTVNICIKTLAMTET
jgi:hypothetical protein